MSRAARFASTCEICAERIEEDEEIVCLEDEWVHRECAEDEGEEIAP